MTRWRPTPYSLTLIVLIMLLAVMAVQGAWQADSATVRSLSMSLSEVVQAARFPG